MDGIGEFNPAIATLEARFRLREARVAVIGLGYVGLPLARAVGEAGFRVLGFDIDSAKVARLAAGESYIRAVPAEALATLTEEGRFSASDDFSRLGEADAILICVPTPLDRHREPDLSAVAATARQVAARLRPGQLVVLESTTWPGTCREVVRPILDATGLACGRDYFLAYSPEREDPGNERFATAGIPKVVGADDPASRRLALALYDQVVVRTVPVGSLAAAEAVKLTENVFRAVNIALVNELKLVFGAMGIDVWEVIEAARTKPFGYMPFWPGPGLGGHCIPIDPFYLAWKAKEFDVATRFIELAGEINTAMPRHVLDKLAEALDRVHGRGFAGSRVLLLGMAYKPNVDDIRESPALRLMELLRARGAVVDYHDPFVPVLPPTREHAALAGAASVALTPAALAGYHAALVVTDHAGVDYALVARHCPLVVDTRNACARAGVAGANVVKA